MVERRPIGIGRSIHLPVLTIVIAIGLTSPLRMLAAGIDGTRPTGASGMPEPQTGSLLEAYYRSFLDDRDLDGYGTKVASRYTEGTLCRLTHSSDQNTRRAAILALGVIGSFQVNAQVARGMKDADPVVRSLAENALWSIWFRADTAENNATLERATSLLARQRFQEAIDLTTTLIGKSPNFAEAYNQRAIAHFRLGRFDASAEDCRKALRLNPYHIGALAGLAQCLIRLERGPEAIDALRRARALQPHHEGIRSLLAELEGDGA